mgnify:CR=1 FL=1
MGSEWNDGMVSKCVLTPARLRQQHVNFVGGNDYMKNLRLVYVYFRVDCLGVVFILARLQKKRVALLSL